MPAKRRPEAGAPKARQSKLAKEHNITAAEEHEIREAYSLFAEPSPDSKEGLLPTSSVRSALIALGIPPKSPAEQAEFISILDPDGEGYASFEPFFAICALKYHAREQGSEAHLAELDEAFALFSNGKDAVITLADLRRVAKILGEDVQEEVLRDMILEANCGAGVHKGVRKEEFEEIMRRAGVWR